MADAIPGNRWRESAEREGSQQSWESLLLEVWGYPGFIDVLPHPEGWGIWVPGLCRSLQAAVPDVFNRAGYPPTSFTPPLLCRGRGGHRGRGCSG